MKFFYILIIFSVSLYSQQLNPMHNVYLKGCKNKKSPEFMLVKAYYTGAFETSIYQYPLDEYIEKKCKEAIKENDGKVIEDGIETFKLTLLAHTTNIKTLIENRMDKELILAKTVIFKEFTDPGLLISMEGDSYYFNYKGFTYDNISKWEVGRQLILVYGFDNGIVMHDPKSRRTANIVLVNNVHPIDEVSNECLKENISTMGMAGCYKQTYENWDKEMNRVYKALKVKKSPKVFKAIQKMQRSWLVYRDNRFKAGRVVHAEDTGTITIIESAARVITPIRNHTLFLLSLLEND